MAINKERFIKLLILNKHNLLNKANFNREKD